MYCKGSSQTNAGSSGCGTENLIDITNYSQIKVRCTAGTASTIAPTYNWGTLCLKNTKNNASPNKEVPIAATGTVTLDISTTNGSWYICVWGYAGSGSVYIDQLYLRA